MMDTRPGPRGPDDVVAVTAGQDHGARFGLRGAEATIGRGPVMDIVLTDPRVSRRHAVLRRERGNLVVDDLGSTAGTAVNGVPIAAPTTLAPGDRVVLGDTELTVLGPRELAPPPPPPPPRPPPPPPPPAPPVPEAGPARVARAEVLLPLACAALGLFAVVAVWMPVLGDRSGTSSVWTLGFAGLRAQAIGSALLAVAGAAAWFAAATHADRRRWGLPAAVATAIAGGLVAGLPLLLATIHVEAVDREPGIALLALAGTAIAACAIAGVVREARVARPAEARGAMVLVASGAGAGGLLAAAAGPLPWVSLGDLELGGLDGDLAAGGWLIPLAVAVAAAGGLALAVARAGETRAALAVAAGACAASAAALTYTTTTAVTFENFRMEVGLSLALTGAAIACVATWVGTLAACLPRPPEGRG
jgi:hypothetical protein